MEIFSKLIERSKRGLLRAVRLCGSTQSLAKKIGVTKQRLNYWKSSTALMPYDVAIRIFIVTNGRVSLYDLRPDSISITKKFIEMILKQSCGLCIINKKEGITTTRSV